MERSGSELDLPGFRFHPTEEELLDYYLRRVAKGKKLNFDIIGTLNIYRHDPSELPKLSKIGEREWYFFVPRDRRSGNGGRPNRTTERGFWKATGSDRPIRSSEDPKRLIGLKKTLVFYTGRAPRGCKTDWVMNEYRLPDSSPSTPPPKEDIVLCKVYRKATSLKELEQRAAVEEETRATPGCVWIVDDFLSDGHNLMSLESSTPSSDGGDVKKEMEDEVSGKIEVEAEAKVEKVCPSGHLPELQLPNHSLEWMHDSFLTQLRSPWPDPWSPYANILNF